MDRGSMRKCRQWIDVRERRKRKDERETEARRGEGPEEGGGEEEHRRIWGERRWVRDLSSSTAFQNPRMASKHNRDQPLDFQGFLNDLQDWELSLKDKDRKLKQHSSETDKINRENRSPAGRMSEGDSSGGGSGGYKYLKHYAAFDRLSGDLIDEVGVPDAASEKELGNDYFKQKKYKEAIDCYSRSIALSPTAVAYANRAMAYLKLKKFHEAEVDCTEALNLDDHYIKAYSRRATARKELGKLKESVEDAEFALRLEPDNQEIKKQHADVRSMYQKEVLEKASGVISKSFRGSHTGGKSETNLIGGGAAILENPVKKKFEASFSVGGTEHRNVLEGSKAAEHAVNGSHLDANNFGLESNKRNNKTQRQELKTSVQELASRAAARAMAETAKNISPPQTAYQFEVSWRAISGDVSLQARLLKVTSPTSLPQIFRNALSASLLVDIVRCVATFFQEDMDLAVKYLENLTKVPRFDILISCVSSNDKEDLCKLWDEVFGDEATPIEYVEILDSLRAMYCIGR